MSKADEPAFYPVPGWPQYEVNTQGVVRSWFIGGTRQQRRRQPHYKKLVTGKDGYLRVTFHEKRKGSAARVETYSIHRLVALVFLPTRDATLDVAHLDGNKANNNAANLKWCTRKENESHKVDHGTKADGSRNGQSKLDERMARAIRELHAKDGLSQSILAERFGVCQGTISALLLKKTWDHVA